MATAGRLSAGRWPAIFGERCRTEGVRPSMGSRGDSYDNAMCESFFATLECELIERDTSPRNQRLVSRSPSSSKAGTIPIGSIPGSATNHHRATKKNTIQKTVLFLRNLIPLSRRESRALSRVNYTRSWHGLWTSLLLKVLHFNLDRADIVSQTIESTRD